MASLYKLLLQPAGIECVAGTEVSVLSSLEALPESQRGEIKVGCRGGGCGMCRIQVLSGSYRTDKMSVRHISEHSSAKGIVLACRTYPQSNLEITAAPL